MPTCGACGKDLPSADFAFCPFCGAAAARPADEQRKTVTVVFADLVGSTELGSRLDPEVLRGVMQSYWATARQAIERHGGSVAKFIGDAAVGVFAAIPIKRQLVNVEQLAFTRSVVPDVIEPNRLAPSTSLLGLLGRNVSVVQ